LAAAKKTAKKATSKKAAKKATKKASAKKATKKAAAKKATKRAPAKKAASSAQVRVPASQVKDFAKAQGLRASSDLADAVSAEVTATLERAAERARTNNRGTIRPQDV
jgi:hypothetical protein